MTPFTVQPIDDEVREQVNDFILKSWGSDRMVSRGKLWYPALLPGFIALISGKIVGLVTYQIWDEQCEVTTLNSEVQGAGIGTALLQATWGAAIASGCRRVWLITTNDNLPALRFYQKRGMRLAALYPNALEFSRNLKPEIPLTGWEGIPIRDEIELELIFEQFNIRDLPKEH